MSRSSLDRFHPLFVVFSAFFSTNFTPGFYFFVPSGFWLLWGGGGGGEAGFYGLPPDLLATICGVSSICFVWLEM